MAIESSKGIIHEMDKKVKRYPISEIFISQQGEGIFTGTMMAFVRFAGCTVGKPFPKDRYLPRDMQFFTGTEKVPGLPMYTEKCTLFDGREMACDTDYRVKERLTVDEIIKQIPDNIRHVCITGGEPLMHDLFEFLKALHDLRKFIHIETSGTIRCPEYMSVMQVKEEWEEGDIWLTVSPKKDYLYEMIMDADEIKLIIDKDTTLDVKWLDIAKIKPTYLQPVNYEHSVNVINLRRCIEIQKTYPQFRLSLQFHKVLELLLEERVR